jgi:hypothetical protein
MPLIGGTADLANANAATPSRSSFVSSLSRLGTRQSAAPSCSLGRKAIILAWGKDKVAP